MKKHLVKLVLVSVLFSAITNTKADEKSDKTNEEFIAKLRSLEALEKQKRVNGEFAKAGILKEMQETTDQHIKAFTIMILAISKTDGKKLSATQQAQVDLLIKTGFDFEGLKRSVKALGANVALQKFGEWNTQELARKMNALKAAYDSLP